MEETMKGTFSKALLLTLISTGAVSSYAMERFTNFFVPKNAHTIAVEHVMAEFSAKQAVELAAQEAAKAAEAVENVAQAAVEASDVAPAVASRLEQAKEFAKNSYEAVKQSSVVQFGSEQASRFGNFVKSMVPTSKPAWMSFSKVSMPQFALTTTDAVKTFATNGVELVKNNPASAAAITGAVVVGGVIAYKYGKGMYNRVVDYFKPTYEKVFAKSTAQANAKAAKKAQTK